MNKLFILLKYQLISIFNKFKNTILKNKKSKSISTIMLFALAAVAIYAFIIIYILSCSSILVLQVLYSLRHHILLILPYDQLFYIHLQQVCNLKQATEVWLRWVCTPLWDGRRVNPQLLSQPFVGTFLLN